MRNKILGYSALAAAFAAALFAAQYSGRTADDVSLVKVSSWVEVFPEQYGVGDSDAMANCILKDQKTDPHKPLHCK